MFGYLGYVKVTMNSNKAEFRTSPEQREIIQQALLDIEEPQAPFYYDALAGLGRQLTGWGELLQEKYDREA